MEVRIKRDSVEISGYVNAIERNSKPLMSRIGQFIERICKGAFKNALKRNFYFFMLYMYNNLFNIIICNFLVFIQKI